MKCVYCESERVVKNGKDQASGQIIQTYRCNECGRRFNERSGTPMLRLRTAPVTKATHKDFALAMKVRSEGVGIRGTGRVLEKSPASIITWEKRISAQVPNWSPPAPQTSEVTLEGDEVYTRVGENRSAAAHGKSLPPRKVPRVDNSLYRTNQSLLGRCTSRT